MAHFAELNNENIVLRVVVICNEDCFDEKGKESEQKGIETCKRLFGENTRWVQTSYTGKIRKNYAGAGYLYDDVRDAFIAPRPSEEFELNVETLEWENKNKDI